MDIQEVPSIPIPEHAKWRYLISADGFTASARLAKILLTNSPVLKEESQWIEYYYRSLRPGVYEQQWRRMAVAMHDGRRKCVRTLHPASPPAVPHTDMHMRVRTLRPDIGSEV